MCFFRLDFGIRNASKNSKIQFSEFSWHISYYAQNLQLHVRNLDLELHISYCDDMHHRKYF